uniref:Peptidase metallopeptidase domain-containing protein n=1 Tax=Ditylenchus dipsaci TaxID=166011 RepID=A0A915CUR5_9BILA
MGKKVWQESHLLRFVLHRASRPVHIEIVFATGDHGDGEPFDGRGQTLAHAFFPQFGGSIHFDDDEKWSVSDGRGKGLDLYSVAVHEIGHALGLKHSENRLAIMAPIYQTRRQVIQLHSDDLQALEYIYGYKHQNEVFEHKDTVQNKPEDISDIAKAFCARPKVDAMTVLPNGTAYAFVGAYVYPLHGRRFNLSCPMLIQDQFPGFQPQLSRCRPHYPSQQHLPLQGRTLLGL